MLSFSLVGFFGLSYCLMAVVAVHTLTVLPGWRKNSVSQGSKRTLVQPVEYTVFEKKSEIILVNDLKPMSHEEFIKEISKAPLNRMSHETFMKLLSKA